jgi:hypothetical protein
MAQRGSSARVLLASHLFFFPQGGQDLHVIVQPCVGFPARSVGACHFQFLDEGGASELGTRKVAQSSLALEQE